MFMLRTACLHYKNDLINESLFSVDSSEVYGLTSIFGNTQVGRHEVEKALHIHNRNHCKRLCKRFLHGTAQINYNFSDVAIQFLRTGAFQVYLLANASYGKSFYPFFLHVQLMVRSLNCGFRLSKRFPLISVLRRPLLHV